MNVKCNYEDCKYWDVDGGDYYGEGGCTLPEIDISEQLTGGGFLPICQDYKERD